ncbi:MAG: hypothetical protein K2W97_01005 [Chthoniobacterales bacterium]|nr:hypothetical protein [Chthoniobacterales bacterium]
MRKIIFFFLLALTAFSFLHAETIAPTQFNVGAFSFTRPDTWKWEVPISPMRKAQLTIPGKNGATALVTFFYFGPGQGGTVQANVDRWAAQFTAIDATPIKATTTTQKINATTVTFVSARGTFLSGMPGGPTQACADYALRGAILESSQGDVYVKMTGPEALVKQLSPIFDSMITTCH